jgi:hypothetical protein
MPPRRSKARRLTTADGSVIHLIVDSPAGAPARVVVKLNDSALPASMTPAQARALARKLCQMADAAG